MRGNSVMEKDIYRRYACQLNIKAEGQFSSLTSDAVRSISTWFETSFYLSNSFSAFLVAMAMLVKLSVFNNTRLFALFVLFSTLQLQSFAIIHNTTYDNLDPNVTYLPQGGDGWDVDIKEGLDYQGSHAVASDDPDAFALFHFIGVAVYYFSPLWPYNVTTALSIDGGNNITVNLMDTSATPANVGSPPTEPSAARFGFTGLSNGSHTLAMYQVQGLNYSDQNVPAYVVVDGFNVTFDDGTSAVANTPHNRTVNVAVIVGGVVGGIIGLAAMITFFLVYHRRVRKFNRQNNSRGEGILDDTHTSAHSRIINSRRASYTDFSPALAQLQSRTTSPDLRSEAGYTSVTTTAPLIMRWEESMYSETSQSRGSTSSGTIAGKGSTYFDEKCLQRLIIANSEEPPAPPPYASFDAGM
ncbi:hypothetical protein F5878DRAFT_617842 [Lentinula raphanica]|uniref:Uncharacterized protein n=1 Tax=Lentinula raphanica TaxID=153919 RepID=A0AA38PAB2_9AGAR|nr:hypothetical protein F5878DRAFT_617842 [Lentinula raphanica]